MNSSSTGRPKARQHQSSRINLKESSVNDSRRSMNKRRHDLSSKIRKSRRSHQVQLKRRTGAYSLVGAGVGVGVGGAQDSSSNTPGSSSSNKTIQDIVHLFLLSGSSTNTNGPDETLLNELQLSLTASSSSPSSSVSASSPNATASFSNEEIISKLLLKEHPQKGHELLSIFHRILTSTNNNHHHNNTAMKLQVLRILTNLAAAAGTMMADEERGDMSYYGPSASTTTSISTNSSTALSSSWCELIIYHHPANILPTALIPCIRLLQHLQLQLQSSPSSIPPLSIYDDLQIVAQACWVIGNLSGDSSSLSSSSSSSSSAATTIRAYMIENSTVINELTQVLKQTLWLLDHHCHDGNQTTNSASQNDQLQLHLIEIMRNSLWALSNLARGSATSALLFLAINANENTYNTMSMGLTSLDIVSILQRGCSGSTDGNSWEDIHVEILWLLAFLTAREDEVIGFLFLDQQQQQQQQHPNGRQHFSSPLLDVLAFHFHQITNKIVQSCRDGNRDHDGNTFRMAIPILRIMGNAACAAAGQFVPYLLTHHRSQQGSSSILQTLSQWMYVIDYYPSHDIMSISTEATWVCGALLCDAGHEQHPSTVLACPIILPALCHILISNKANATLEWKREVLSALWNAISPPPNNGHNVNFNNTMTNLGSTNNLIEDDTIGIRDKLLQSICEIEGLLKSIVGMIRSLDVDVIQLSLYIINAVHRRIIDLSDYSGTIKRVLDEAHCLDVLEGVCDSVSANVQYGAGRKWGKEGNKNNNNDSMEACAEIAASLIDDFYDEQNMDNDFDEMDKSKGFEFTSQSFNFGIGSAFHQGTTESQSISTSMSGQGRGRGRGSATPAWMVQR